MTKVAEPLRVPGAETGPGIGHAPTLAEPVLEGAIERLLEQALEPATA